MFTVFYRVDTNKSSFYVVLRLLVASVILRYINRYLKKETANPTNCCYTLLFVLFNLSFQRAKCLPTTLLNQCQPRLMMVSLW